MVLHGKVGEKMVKSKKRRAKRLLAVLSVLLVINIFFLLFTFRMRPVIINFAENIGERTLLNAANEAVSQVLQESATDYSDIVVLTADNDGRVTSLEINTVNVNLLKSRIAMKISEIVASKESYNMFIPTGTFLGSEFTTGLGPKIAFSMQISTYSIVNLKYEFIEAGLNQVLHRISFDIEMHGRLVMTGISDSFTVSTNAIVAETVIVGITPDAYTNVIESNQSANNDLAGDINDYGAGQ